MPAPLLWALGWPFELTRAVGRAWGTCRCQSLLVMTAFCRGLQLSPSPAARALPRKLPVTDRTSVSSPTTSHFLSRKFHGPPDSRSWANLLSPVLLSPFLTPPYGGPGSPTPFLTVWPQTSECPTRPPCPAPSFGGRRKSDGQLICPAQKWLMAEPVLEKIPERSIPAHKGSGEEICRAVVHLSKLLQSGCPLPGV